MANASCGTGPGYNGVTHTVTEAREGKLCALGRPTNITVQVLLMPLNAHKQGRKKKKERITHVYIIVR